MTAIIDFRVTLPGSTWREANETRSDYMGNYGRIYQRARGGGSTVEELLTGMDAHSIGRAVLQAEWASGDYRRMNDAVHRIVEAHPARFVGYVTVNPAAAEDMAAVVEHEVRERGARGVNLQPFAYRLRANDRRFYPLYQKCQELGIPVTVHTSINFSNNRPIDFGRPLYLCDVACDFPELVIVANHGGWPWVPEMAAVAWKHQNVFVELGGVSPRYLGMAGAGWEMLMQHGNSALLRDRVLLATDNMLPYERVLAEFADLPLRDETKERWLGPEALLERVENPAGIVDRAPRTALRPVARKHPLSICAWSAASRPHRTVAPSPCRQQVRRFAGTWRPGAALAPPGNRAAR